MSVGQVQGRLAGCALAFRIDTTRRLSVTRKSDVVPDLHGHLVVCLVTDRLEDCKTISINLASLQTNLRVLEMAYSSKLFALDTFWKIWIALDLFLSASRASNCQSLSWFPRFGHTPVCIDSFTINDSLAMGSVVIEVADALARYFR